MNVANIEITRVIAHEVVRASQLTERPPILSDELIRLDEQGNKLVGTRLVNTIASGSHCVDVTVDDATIGSPFEKTTAMLDSDDAGFVKASRQLANTLSTAQTAGPIKSGSAIFVQGSCVAGGQDSRFIAIIKADSDQGFYKRIDRGNNITLTYVNDMLLGESQRLIKIAFYIEETELEEVEEEGTALHRSPEDFSVKVFDHMMQSSGDGNAAIYFYSTFLKCRLADNAPRKTKRFYEAAREFIDKMDIPQSEKVELRGDLISYLRGNRATLEPRAFAQDVLPQDNQETFLRTCRDIGIDEAITKDLQLLKGKMRRQSVKFSSNVTLYAPPDVFRESVKITGTTEDGWTELQIQGLIESMP
jgi:hypothetical protein